jgi:DeoR family transcriptional regulator, fructose operon transcriptional repressor
VGRPEERKEKLIELLRLYKQLDVGQVSAALRVSDATVRRLFGRLEEERLAIRTHGGIRLVPEIRRDYSFHLSQTVGVAEKAAIGFAAAKLCLSDDVVFLDSGSTVMKCAEAILIRLQQGSLSGLTVLTNSLDVAELFAGHCKTISIGGEVRAERRDVCGMVAERTLMSYRVDHAFLGADGIDEAGGLMTTDERTATMNQVVIGRSGRTTVLADHSKFDQSSFVTYADLNQVGLILTDEGLRDEDADRFVRMGAEIETVPMSIPVSAPAQRDGNGSED